MRVLAFLCCLLRAGSAALLAPAVTRLGEEGGGGGGQGRPPWDGGGREKEAAAALRVGAPARTYTRDPRYAAGLLPPRWLWVPPEEDGWRGAALPLLTG